MTNCKWCGSLTQMTGTRMCDRCWELWSRITRDPQLAERMLKAALKQIKQGPY